MENFSEAFHAAVRKELHSPYSTILYHTIHLVPEDVWGAFCKYMKEGLKTKPIQLQKFTKLLMLWNSDNQYLQPLYQTDNKKWKELANGENVSKIRLFDAVIHCTPQEDIQQLVDVLNIWL